MLSKCNHFILTNSSFGYWSYLLNIIRDNDIDNTYCFFPDKFFMNQSRYGKYNKKIINSYFRKMNVFLYSTSHLLIMFQK